MTYMKLEKLTAVMQSCCIQVILTKTYSFSKHVLKINSQHVLKDVLKDVPLQQKIAMYISNSHVNNNLRIRPVNALIRN